ncbi:unnamed protein product [Cyclocybe aegerita]|uniref:DUF4604 domain-containing protein n=1 Tax=Cyclocybe aegerita TaxID=1973307 RepID=A0A8S0XNC9_CYCAE|nr:unnamed protein product [Cyclocybe aegerita]
MAPREPTRAQLSSRLAYQQSTPSFLLKLQNRINGIPDEDDDDDEEFEYVGGGREPIPKRPRPAIPERPQDDPGSADEDDGDEKPQVVVLKAGKHLTEREAENVRRAEKGLPPLPHPDVEKKDADPKQDKSQDASSSTSKSTPQGLTFSSSSKAGPKSNKRKAVGMLDEIKSPETSKDKAKNPSKKLKKEKKTLLSFGDDT